MAVCRALPKTFEPRRPKARCGSVVSIPQPKYEAVSSFWQAGGVNKCLIQAISAVCIHEALRISETVELSLTQHVEIIAMRNDLIDIV